MTLPELTEILEEKHYWLKPMTVGSIKYSKKTLTEVNEQYGSVESYLNKIAKVNNDNTVNIALYCKNGNSPKIKYRYTIDLLGNSKSINSNENQYRSIQSNNHQYKSIKSNNNKQSAIKINTHQYDSIQSNGLTRANKALKKKDEQVVSKADIEVVQLKIENKSL